MFKANGQQFLRLYSELQRQLGEDVFTETVDDHRDGIVFADPALQAVEQLIFANPRGGRLVLQLGAVVAAFNIREGMRPAVRADQHRIALGIVAGVGGGRHDFDQPAIAVLTVSGGDPFRDNERQRVHIARALAQSPSEILLDEPTNHLDIHHQMQLMQLISELPVTSIVAIHDLNHAAMFCDSLIVMQQGQILASGTPEEILSEALLWDVFRVKTKIEISPYHGKKHIHFIV